LHIYADSKDGIKGLSMVQVAADAINIAAQADHAARRLFKNGMMVGGALSHPGKLSQDARDHLRSSMDEKYKGEDNAGKWMILEEGLVASQLATTAQDSQQIETRRYQVEDIARAFGVPRPFLGMDDTSWGSGVDVLGQIFVRYALNPWFTVWEQAIKRSLIDPAEMDQYEAKFNPGALIRGNMKDQAEFFAKALGSGGHQPWMGYDEIRDISDLPEREIAPNPLAAQMTFKQEPSNEPS
jgi:HK97 family phage portal protein